MIPPGQAPVYAALAIATSAVAVLAVAWLRERSRRRALELRTAELAAVAPSTHGIQPREIPPHQQGRVAETESTDVARHEEMLRRSERLASLGRMLAGTAHELNNPLAAVCGFAQLLLRGDVSEEQRLALETIDREATRAASVVRDLLTFARHHDQEAPRAVDLNAIARYVVGTRRYSLRAGGVSLELELSSGPLWVRGVATQLEQVVFNLVANAEQALEASVDAQASADGEAMTSPTRDGQEDNDNTPGRQHDAGSRPRIVVRTSSDGEMAVLRVEDNGPGISPERLSLIWDPFWTTRADSEGTGLGLPVVHGIVSSHNGTAEVESRPGHGATFIITLPLDHDAAGVRMSGRGVNGTAPQPLDILVLGKEEDATFLTRLLGARGHAVVTASEMEHAMRLTAGGGFDVVVADAALLDSSAEPWLAGLANRLGPNDRPTRILMVSDTRQPSPSSRPSPTAGSVRPDATLTRPFEVEALRRMVERS